MLISHFQKKDNEYLNNAVGAGAALSVAGGASAYNKVSKKAPGVVRRAYRVNRVGMGANKARKLAGQSYRGIMKRAVGSSMIRGAAMGVGAGVAGTALNKMRKKYVNNR